MFKEQLVEMLDYAALTGCFNKINMIKQADNVCVFGLGKYFNDSFVKKRMKENYGVNILCDNNPEKWGQEFHGIVCVKPEKLIEYENLVVIIMLGRPSQVEKQLKDMNVTYVNHLELSLDEIMNMQSDTEWFRKEYDAILKVYDLLTDDESKRVWVNALCNRIAPRCSQEEWQQIYCGMSDYFNRRYINMSDDESYVDCGAYNGDSIENFIHNVQSYKEIYGFELDKQNYDEMRTRLKDKQYHDLNLFNCGVWNENSVIEYGTGDVETENAEGISIFKSKTKTDNYIRTAEVTKLDDILCGKNITFIKMDVEGAEVMALEGAKNIIEIQKPKLAICLYHRTSDFWSIPMLLHKINPNYNFGVMHHCKYNCWGTVLYAW